MMELITGGGGAYIQDEGGRGEEYMYVGNSYSRYQ